MRWVLVARHAHPDRSGVGAAHALMLRAAARAGWSVELVTEAPVPVPEGVRITVVRAARGPLRADALVPALRRLETVRPLGYGRWALAATRELARQPRHVDGIEFPDTEGSAHLALRSARVADMTGRAPILVHAHTPLWLEDEINGVPPERFGRPVTHGWERAAFGAADSVLAPSHLLAARLGRLRRDIAVAPYPLAPLARPAGENAPRAPEGKSLVFVGSLQARKGVDVLVDAVCPLLRRRPDLRLDLVGPDTTATPAGTSVQAELRRRIPAELRARVRFHGARRHAEVRSMLALARVVVVPSRFEAFGLAAAEAVLLERPLVLSDACGVLEALPDMPAVPAGDVSALGAALEDALAAPTDAAALRRRRDELLAACTASRALAVREALAAEPIVARRVPVHGVLDDAAAALAGMLRAARDDAECPVQSGP